MAHTYTPRRCSKRWLDGDCPRDVLAIIDLGPNEPGGRYDVIYADVVRDDRDAWLGGIILSEAGVSHGHFELKAHEVAAYRYRMKHRYTTWTSLPEAVKKAVRDDIAYLAEVTA